MKTSFKFLAASLLIAIFCIGRGRGIQAGKNIHPLKISEGGLIVVSVLAADSVDARFILDTGAGIHVLSDRLLKRLHSVPAGRFTGFRHTGERVDFEMFQIQFLSIGGFRQENPVVAAWSLLDSFNIDGILSLKFFENRPFTFDLHDTVLVFETQKTLSERLSKGRRAAIRVADDRGKSLDLFVDVQAADSLRLECILDTGSPATILDAGFMRDFGIDTTSKDTQKRARRSPFGALETEYITTVPSISLWDVPSATAKNFRATFKHRLIYDGLLGTDFLIGRRITFNIPERYLIIGTD